MATATFKKEQEQREMMCVCVLFFKTLLLSIAVQSVAVKCD